MADNETSAGGGAADPAPEDAGACDWRPQAEIAWNIAQAKSLKEQAAKGGLRFEAVLGPAQALWFLGLIERRKFGDAGEALFVMLGEMQDLEPHGDLRKELLKRSLDAALNDPGPPVPLEDIFASLNEKREGPKPAPAIWKPWPGELDEQEASG